jgi:hypothetical protein
MQAEALRLRELTRRVRDRTRSRYVRVPEGDKLKLSKAQVVFIIFMIATGIVYGMVNC